MVLSRRLEICISAGNEAAGVTDVERVLTWIDQYGELDGIIEANEKSEQAAQGD